MWCHTAGSSRRRSTPSGELRGVGIGRVDHYAYPPCGFRVGILLAPGHRSAVKPRLASSASISATASACRRSASRTRARASAALGSGGHSPSVKVPVDVQVVVIGRDLAHAGDVGDTLVILKGLVGSDYSSNVLRIQVVPSPAPPVIPILIGLHKENSFPAGFGFSPVEHTDGQGNVFSIAQPGRQADDRLKHIIFHHSVPDSVLGPRCGTEPRGAPPRLPCRPVSWSPAYAG